MHEEKPDFHKRNNSGGKGGEYQVESLLHLEHCSLFDSVAGAEYVR